MTAAIERARRAGDDGGRRGALLAWQHAAATLLEIDFAAPTPAHLRRKGDVEAEWVALWSESDRLLYGREAVLDGGWYERARALGKRLRRPFRNPLRAFLPRHLVPRSAVAVLLIGAVAAHAAAGAAGATEAADVQPARDASAAAAEAPPAAREVTSSESPPSDWVARYNRGLEAAQRGEHGRALAETAAAFVHQPRSEAVRWNLAVFAARVPALDRLLARFAVGEPAAALASSASPAVWQLVSLAAAVLLCLGAGRLLHRMHAATAPARRRSAVAAGLIAAGLLLGAAGWACLAQYGALADPSVALVAEPSVLRSVPTDAESSQAQRPLAAGAVVVMEKDFLGWTKVVLPDGEEGWLRRQHLVPLYQPRA